MRRPYDIHETNQIAIAVHPICQVDRTCHGPSGRVSSGIARHPRVGRDGTDLRFQRYVAAPINTGTTIITFLMVFLIQSTQNRDAEAVQVKLDELIRAIGNAKNELLDLEELEEEELDEMRETYCAMAKKAREERDVEHDDQQRFDPNKQQRPTG